MKQLIVFDLDGTMTESKSVIDAEMAPLLDAVLGFVRVAIISGGAWPQFEAQVLAHLCSGDRLRRLSLLPTCGTRFYAFHSEWTQLYAENFTMSERDKITDALQQVIAASG